MFLLDSIREKVGSDGDDSEGFPDMNYIVGNTSGLDIGQVPGPIDQRIGRMSQIGGSLMEIQITNPATFQIDRRELLNVINQIDLDITLHGDPNIGFTGAYATRAQQAAGYNIVHRYMKRYLEQMAAFKYEIDNREDLDFTMGYVNMHASNEQIPPLEERLASDIAVDPFGEQTIDFDDRDERRVNIWKNEDFLENLFDYWFLEVVEQPYQYYEPRAGGIFSIANEDFKDSWIDGKEAEADKIFRTEPDSDEKISLMQAIAGSDQDVNIEYLDQLEDTSLPSSFSITISITDREGNTHTDTIQFNTLQDVANNIIIGNTRNALERPRQIPNDLYRMRQGSNISIRSEELKQNMDYNSENISGTINVSSIENALENLAENIWNSDVVSVEAKTGALASNLDIQQSQIWEDAQNRDDVKDAARDTFAHTEWEDRKKIFEQLAGGRERDEFLKESAIFFQIMPAWMQTADQEYENHPSFDAPKFIWEAIVEDTFDSHEEYIEYYNESRENQLNIIAAVGCAYIWGHWTQVENTFDTQAFEGMLADIPEPSLKESGRYTWSEWMNKFDLTVNIEAMYGDPGQLRRVWRPKDIAVACHAINKTAQKQSSNWAEDYKGPVAKFTIDMEHTASYGVDPYQEIEAMIESEQELAAEGLIDADPDKPLAKILKTYHLTKPGWEQQQGHRHGPFARGDITLYKWLHHMIEAGFARNEDDRAVVMFEVGGEYREEMYVIRVAMDMIQQGIAPEDLDPSKVPLEDDYRTPEEALMARFFGMDQTKFNREWAKIEENAFNPLDGLLEAEQFDYTWSGQAAIQKDNRPQEWEQEEYK